METIQLADFVSLRIAREDRAALALNPRTKGNQLQNAMVAALVRSTHNNAMTKRIAERALGALAVNQVRA